MMLIDMRDGIRTAYANLQSTVSSISAAVAAMPTTTTGDDEQPPEVVEAYRGADETDSVWVTVNLDPKIVSFDLRSNWDSHVSASGFGGAVHSAYMNAMGSALRARSALQKEEQQSPTADVPQDPKLLRSEQGGRDRVADLRRCVAVLDDLDEQATELQRKMASSAADDGDDELAETRSPLGYVTVRVKHGALHAVVGDTEAIIKAGSSRLIQDVWAAFEAAGLTAGSGPGSSEGELANEQASIGDDADFDDHEPAWEGIEWE